MNKLFNQHCQAALAHGFKAMSAKKQHKINWCELMPLSNSCHKLLRT